MATLLEDHRELSFRYGVFTWGPDEQARVRQESVSPGLVARGPFCLRRSPQAFPSQAPGLPSHQEDLRVPRKGEPMSVTP